MKQEIAIRYRVIDILVLLTVAGLAISSYSVGFRVIAPLFLTSGFDSYTVTETVEGEEKIWHKQPPQSTWERFSPRTPDEEYAIRGGRSTSVPQVVTNRISWLPLFYDILITTLALLFAIAGVRHFRGAKRAT